MAETGGNASSRGSQGFLRSLKTSFTALTSGLHTRIELAIVEIEEEFERLKQTLLLTMLLYFSLSLGIILLTIFIVGLFWESGWLYALGCLALLYLGIGLTAGLILRKKISQRPRLLSATLAELTKDRERLKAAYRE